MTLVMGSVKGRESTSANAGAGMGTLAVHKTGFPVKNSPAEREGSIEVGRYQIGRT